MGVRELGNPLGNPLGIQRKGGAQSEGLLATCSFAVSVPTQSTVDYVLPWLPADPSCLSIRYVSNPGGGYANNRSLLIPYPITGSGISVVSISPSLASRAQSIEYVKTTNAIRVSTGDSTAAAGTLLIELYRRTVKDSAIVTVAESKIELPFNIRNPTKTFVSANISRTGGYFCSGFLSQYMPDNGFFDLYGYGSSNYIFKATAPNLVIAGPESKSYNIIEFE